MKDDPATTMEQTARNLRHQSEILNEQAKDLVNEARRTREASRKARRVRVKKSK